MLNIGKAIADLRIGQCMSQQELADRLYVSRDLVSKWETGTRQPDFRMIEKIADIFSVPVEEIADKNDIVFRELSECVPLEISIDEDTLAKKINAFLHLVSKKDADIFVMRFYFLKSSAQIAQACGISENHVRSRLSKTRSKLRKYLKEELQ